VLLCSTMRCWISRSKSSTSVILAAVVCTLLVDECLSQTYDVNYYTESDCRSSSRIAHHPNSILEACNDVTDLQGDERGYKISCAKDTSAHASYAATSMLINVDPVQCGHSAAHLTEFRELPLENVCFHIQGSVAVYVKWSYPATAASICGETLPSPSPPPVVVGDPVTWYGNVREEFWLPHRVLSPLLLSPDMQVLASSRPGHEEDQWIDRIVVASAAGEHVLDVTIKRNLTYFDRATLLPDSFETLDVKMEWWRSGLMAVMPPGDAQFNHWSGISLGFGRVRHFGQTNAGVAPRREAVYVMSSSLKILILSSGAREYFIDRGDSKHLAMEYSHLDLEIMEIRDNDELRGILPELWGILPMSEETKALRKISKEEPVVVDGRGIRIPPLTDSCDIANRDAAGNCSVASETQTLAFRKKIDSGEAVPVASVEGLSEGSGATSEDPALSEVTSLAASL